MPHSSLRVREMHAPHPARTHGINVTGRIGLRLGCFFLQVQATFFLVMSMSRALATQYYATTLRATAGRTSPIRTVASSTPPNGAPPLPLPFARVSSPRPANRGVSRAG
jgi:hypothetical protein